MDDVLSIEEAVERLYDLNVGVVGIGPSRHERPHKPAMLLAAIDLIARGKFESDRIAWSEELRNRFGDYFDIVRGANDQPTPENPFYHLRSDQIWFPYEILEEKECELRHVPTVQAIQSSRVFARITGGLEHFVQSPSARMKIRRAIVARYFPKKSNEIFRIVTEQKLSADAAGRPREEEEDFGRKSSFRRKVVELYDSQCAVCGLRIKHPEKSVSFVDGAHLIPFSESRNDHPSNGIALCKNHHWAMDSYLLVPTTAMRWRVSPRLDSRRSSGEESLISFHDKPLLRPHDDAFLPHIDGLRWREERLYV